MEVAAWLAERLQQEDRCWVGIDHGFSFPLDYFKRNKLKTWPAFLEDFVQHWPTAGDNATVEQFRSKSKRTGDAKELRLTDRWTSSAKSVFQFDVQGSVAKSTHAGLPFLKQLRDQNPNLHFWPFNGWDVPEGKSVVAEIYPSLFRNRYPRESRTVDQQDAFFDLLLASRHGRDRSARGLCLAAVDGGPAKSCSAGRLDIGGLLI